MKTLWHKFADSCPFIAHVPFLRHWAFGVWARAYTEARISCYCGKPKW